MYCLCSSYMVIIFTCVLCSPVQNEAHNVSKHERNMLDELQDMVSSLLDKDMTVVPKEVYETQRQRKSVNAEEKSETTIGNLQRERTDDVSLLPMYPCDEYDEVRRSCINIRQIGTTLTFGVHVDGKENANDSEKDRIRWFRIFKVLHSKSDIKEELTIERKPWNINLAGNKKEMRISPITETDYSYNYFVAILGSEPTLQRPQSRTNLHFLKFLIEPLAIDMGVLYHGEEIFINARAFVELPEDSIQFDWRQSDVDRVNSLPRNTGYVSSNMQTNADGSALIIKEFRNSADKILSCGIYSNKNVFIARRDFRLRKIAEPDDTTIDKKHSYLKRRKKRSSDEDYEYTHNEEDKPDLDYSDRYYDDMNPVNGDISVARKEPIPLRLPLEIVEESPSSYNRHDSQHSLIYRRQPQQYLRSRKRRLGRNYEYVYSDDDKQDLDDPIDSEDYIKPADDEMSAARKDSAYSKQPPLIKFKEPPSSNRNRGSQHRRHSGRQKVTPFQDKVSQLNLDKQQATPKTPPLKDLIDEANSLAKSPTIRKDFEFHPTEIRLQGILTFEDAESMLICRCKGDSECGIHAFCHGGFQEIDTTILRERKFCRCRSGYIGNGAFCWLLKESSNLNS